MPQKIRLLISYRYWTRKPSHISQIWFVMEEMKSISLSICSILHFHFFSSLFLGFPGISTVISIHWTFKITHLCYNVLIECFSISIFKFIFQNSELNGKPFKEDYVRRCITFLPLEENVRSWYLLNMLT